MIRRGSGRSGTLRGSGWFLFLAVGLWAPVACSSEDTGSSGPADDITGFPTLDVGHGGGDGPGGPLDASGDDDAIVEGCQDDLDCTATPPGPCLVSACNTEVHKCIFTASPAGTPCASGNACLKAEICVEGACTGGQQIGCDDGEPCTIDTCSPATGCVHTLDELCCEPECAGKVCGPNGCGGTCGDCPAQTTCNAQGLCESGGCTPQCAGKVCGSDGCGLTCGNCPAFTSCGPDGLCHGNCTPSCTGKTCGSDGCGGSCGSCGAGLACTPSGQCKPPCTPQCGGKACGEDGCGGLCGTCPFGQVCQATGQCACTVNCAGKECGDDGCGGSCGSCNVPGEICAADGTCDDPTKGSVCNNPFVIPGVPFSTTTSTTGASNDFSFGPTDCEGVTSSTGGAGPDHVYAFQPQVGGNYQVQLDPDWSFDSALYAATDCGDIPGTCLGAQDKMNGTEELILYVNAGVTAYLFVDGWSDSFEESGTYTLTVGVYDKLGCTPDCDGKECGDDGCDGQCGMCLGGLTCGASAQCVVPGTGETCWKPYDVDSVPFQASGTTEGAGKDMGYGDGACPGETWSSGDASGDHVFRLDPPVPGNYLVALDADFTAVLYAVTDCGDVDGTCLGANTSWFDQELVVYAGGGQSVYVVVDGDSDFSDYTGAYSLTITPFSKPGCTPDCGGKECGDDGCEGLCGLCGGADVCGPSGSCVAQGTGDTCALPFVVDEIPFTATGNTEGAGPDYGFEDDACPGATFGSGAGSADHVYRFDPPGDGNYEITLDADFTAVLYAVGDCSDVDASCLAASDKWSAQEIVVYGLWGQSLYIIVDGDSTWSNYTGAYTLTFTAFSKPGCTPDCAGKDCGDDGCGGYCGACQGADVCAVDGCVDPSVGDTCESAIPVGSLPFSVWGDTSYAQDDYAVSSGDCPGSVWSVGDGGVDHVYGFDVPATGTYQVTLSPTQGFDSALYAVTDCQDIPSSCLGAEDQFGSSPETLQLDLTQNSTVFLVVDAYSGTFNASGGYNLKVTAQ